MPADKKAVKAKVLACAMSKKSASPAARGHRGQGHACQRHPDQRRASSTSWRSRSAASRRSAALRPSSPSRQRRIARDVKKVLQIRPSPTPRTTISSTSTGSTSPRRASAAPSRMKRFHARARGRRREGREDVQQSHRRRARARGRQESANGPESQSDRASRSASTAPGIRAGSPTTTTPSCCMRTCKLRKFLMERLSQAGVSRVVIERPAKKARITIHTARPGVVIGKKGADIEKLRLDLAKMTGGEVALNIVEIRKPEIDAKLIAENIAQQLERRVAFRRAMKRAVQSAMRLGALGIRINCSGRLGGAEIARMEWYREGRVPLHTLRADVDFGSAPPRPPTAPAASRCGCSRARSWRMTRWRRTSAPPSSRPGARELRTRSTCSRPRRTKYRKAHKGRIHGAAKGGADAQFRRLRPEGPGAGAASPRARSRRRGAPSRRHMKRVGRVWIRIFPDVPVSHQAGRSAHGQRQGHARVLGLPGQSRPHHVRARRRAGPDRARGLRAGRRQAADQDASSSAGWARSSEAMKAGRSARQDRRTS